MAVTCDACGHWSLSGEHACPVVWADEFAKKLAPMLVRVSDIQDRYAVLVQYAREVCELCLDDYPAHSERGQALERLWRLVVTEREAGEGGKKP